jgi:2-polyprenyl-3-methyl-5-hydroxy-6-metoxy-1,4-benzoquinol methylase
MEKIDLYKNYSEINSHIQNYNEDYYLKTAREYNEMYSYYLPEDKNASILDIGCGNGIFLYFLKKQGYTNFQGIDADQSSINIVHKHITDKAEKADAFEFLDKKPATFDLIVMNEVLEHINKDEIIPLIGRVYNSLKKGGIFICYVPNMENPFTIYTRYHDFTHTIGFTQNSLRMVLKAGGFNSIEVRPTTSSKKSLKKMAKKILQDFVKLLLVNLFEYPKNGFLTAMRIYAISKK